MPLKHIKKLLFGAPRLPREEAMKVFKRDHFKCQYCGLDGLHRFENWLILTIDHIHPHARGGSRSMDNLVTACQPCNLIKGKRPFASFEDAKKFVLAKREEWRHAYQDHVKSAGAAGASH
jgi:5-methylcytosine-specific restriction endonuclease McrA